MTSWIIRAAAIAAISLNLAACAGETESRHLSGQTAAVLNDYRRAMDDFAAGQTALNAQNDNRVLAMEGGSARARAYSAVRLAAFKTAGDSKALALYTSLTARPIDDIIKSSAILGSLNPPPASTTVSFDGTAVNAVVKQLTALGKEPDLAGRVQALLKYRQEMQDAYQETLDDAAKKSGEADSEAKKTDGEVTTSTPDPKS
jgi:hypothetical protein